MTIDLKVLDGEKSMLGENYRYQLEGVIRMTLTALEAYKLNGRIDKHLGHNLGNRATEIATLGAKVDEVERFKLYIEQNNPPVPPVVDPSSVPDEGDLGDTDR